MTILAIANTSTDMGGSTSVATTSGTFDSEFSSESASVYLTSSGGIEGFNILHGEPTGDLWVHFCCKLPTYMAGNSGVDGNWFACYNKFSEKVFDFDLNNGVGSLVVYGDTTETSVNIPLISGSLSYYDLKLEVGADIIASLYIDGVLAATVTAVNTAGKLNAVVTSFEHEDFIISGNYGNAARYVYYSQILITDGEITLGKRVSTLKPTTDGNYTEWEGGATELSDSSPATNAISDTAGQRVSWNVSAFGGSPSVTGISAVISSCTATRGTAGPQSLKHFLRIGGVDYEGSSLFPDGETTLIEKWDLNPDTGLAWTVSDLALFEGGLLSEA